jgi:hypothetical protein
MSDGDSKKVFTLVNVDTKGLGDTAKALLDKVSEAIGGIARPMQTRRVAEAEADAKEIGAMSDIRITTLQKRAAQRWLVEEEQKQANMETIVAAALPQVKLDAQSNKIERDWLVNFFDKSRLTSDEEMQQLWAKILAGEANAPGKFSKRTVNLMASLDKNDAELFQVLCRFNWVGAGLNGLAPVIFDFRDPLYSEHGVTHKGIARLCEAGLTVYDTSVIFKQPIRAGTPYELGPTMEYDGRRIGVYRAKGVRLTGRRVDLTRTGADIALLCAAQPVDGMFEHAVAKWKADGAKVKLVTGPEILPDNVPAGEVAHFFGNDS